MKNCLIFACLILGASSALGQATAVGPSIGMDSDGNALRINLGSPTSNACSVFQMANGVPVEMSGTFYFQGIEYPVGYKWAEVLRIYAGKTNQ